MYKTDGRFNCMSQMMAERRQWSRLWVTPRNTGPVVTSVPVTLTTPQFCTHWVGMKRVQANVCLCRSVNCLCTSSCPSENCRNRVPTRAPTAPSLTTNVIKNIEESQEAALNLSRAIPPFVLHQDSPTLSPSILLRVDEWPTLPARTNTAHMSLELTETADPNPAAPADVSNSTINSNHAQPTDFQTASPSLPADIDSDVTLVASIGESDGDSDSVESAEKSPTSPANKPHLEGHVSKMEEIHEVAEGELVKLALPTVIFSCIYDLELPELDDAETKSPETHQDNGATPPFNTQPTPPHSPL